MLVALVPYSIASWSYLGLLWSIHGVVKPSVVLERFDIDVGTIYSGMSKTVNASARVMMPGEYNVVFYGVEYIGDGNASSSPELVNYTVTVFLEDYSNLLGTFSNMKNLTTTLPGGEHTLLFIIRIDTPVVEEPVNFTLQIYMATG